MMTPSKFLFSFFIVLICSHDIFIWCASSFCIRFVGELFGIGNSIYATASSTSQGTSTNTKYSISSEKEKEKSSAMSTIIKKLGQSYSTNPDGVNQNTNSYYSRSSSANNSSSNLNSYNSYY